jgi:DNA-binding NtrC family response regulator
MTEDATCRLMAYGWPGTVRELENAKRSGEPTTQHEKFQDFRG